MSLKVISLFKTTDKVADMVRDRYDYLKNTVVILGYNRGVNISEYRKKYPKHKIVIYQLEQLYNFGSMWYNPSSTEWVIKKRTRNIRKALTECDEIWDYDLDNIEFIKQQGYKTPIKFVPMQYSDSLIEEKKKYDVLFYGAINKRRYEFLKHLDKHFNLLVLTYSRDKDKFPLTNIKSNVYGDELRTYIENSKVIVNIHYYEGFLQEQVRVFEVLHYNRPVVSEVSRRNYLNLPEFKTKEEMIDKVKEAMTNKKSVIEDFKKPFKVGVAYNSFYGLRQLEKSIDSIRDVVDTIVVVHQTKSFSGVEQPFYNRAILDRLSKKIDKIIYYNKNDQKAMLGMIDKRNVGLEYLKEQRCDYVLPMDTDERYNAKQLYNELHTMWVEGIDTLYSPIKTYYGDENHYFYDTYYVPTAYKIDNRKFIQTNSSVLADPARKMKEGKYKVSDMYMNHYSYMKQEYEEKYQTKPMALMGLKDNTNKIKQHLDLWKAGDKALVHLNNLKDKGKLYLAHINLNKEC